MRMDIVKIVFALPLKLVRVLHQGAGTMSKFSVAVLCLLFC